jgi:hypothetical protein
MIMKDSIFSFFLQIIIVDNNRSVKIAMNYQVYLHLVDLCGVDWFL